MSENTRNRVIGKINKIKANIESFISDVNVKDLKSSINLLFKDAHKDFNRLVDKDVDAVRKRLQKEKEDFEVKARKFLEAQKKEFTTLQEKLDTLVKATTKLKEKRHANAPRSQAAGTRKKTAKITNKKVTAKPRTTKKANKKKV
jgi:hypothetical protein